MSATGEQILVARCPLCGYKNRWACNAFGCQGVVSTKEEDKMKTPEKKKKNPPQVLPRSQKELYEAARQAAAKGRRKRHSRAYAGGYL